MGPAVPPFPVWAHPNKIRGMGDVFVVRVPLILHAWTFANACWATSWPSPADGWRRFANPYDPYLGEPQEAPVRFGWTRDKEVPFVSPISLESP